MVLVDSTLVPNLVRDTLPFSTEHERGYTSIRSPSHCYEDCGVASCAKLCPVNLQYYMNTNDAIRSLAHFSVNNCRDPPMGCS